MISHWPDPDRMRIGSYVASLDLRNLKSRTCYQQVLHSFQDSAERHGMLDQQALQCQRRSKSRPRGGAKVGHCGAGLRPPRSCIAPASSTGSSTNSWQPVQSITALSKLCVRHVI